MQTQEQVNTIYRTWIDTVRPTWFPTFLDSANNARMMHEWLRANNLDYALNTLTAAATALKHQYELRTTEIIAAEQAAKAKAEEQQRLTQKNVEVVNFWLKNHAPLGLLGASGEPFAGDIDRFVEFVNRNYDGVFSIEALNAAVTVLTPVLTFYDRSPEAIQLRNVPPPPPRALSVQARRDAGLLPVNPNGSQSHTKDSAPMTPQEIAQQTKAGIMKKLGMPSEEEAWRIKAEALQIMGRRGVNWRETDDLRKSFIWKPGQKGRVPDWKATFELRSQLADAAEKKNR